MEKSGSGVLVVEKRERFLTAAEFQSLADVPPEVEWFANIQNANTRRAYKNDVNEFMAFASIRRPEEFRMVKRSHLIALAGSIREAQELIATVEQQNPERRFNILISDLGLPDGSGHDLMRDLVRHHPIPGIALSGYGMNDDIRDSMDAGFSRHITKPVDWQELKTAIQKIAAEQA